MNITIETILTLAWENLDNPLLLGLFTAIVMIFLLRPLIETLTEKWWTQHHDEPCPEKWRERGLIINTVTFLVCFVTAMLRLSFDWGSVTVLAVVSMFAAIGEYELLKNILGTFGVDLANFNPFG